MSDQLSYSSQVNTIALVIPARMDSKRYFGKLLELYKGKEILRHVLEIAQRATIPGAEVWVATDSEVIASKVLGWGGKVFRSQPGLRNGTERIAEFSRYNPRDFYINIQGDDPTIAHQVITRTYEELILGKFQVVTPCFRITNRKVFNDPNKVKIVKKSNDAVVYFSRSPIPNIDSHESKSKNLNIEDGINTLGHIGVYGYTFESLHIYDGLPESQLEIHEKLEQLRFIESGIEIGTFLVEFTPSAVDSPLDLVALNQEVN